MQARQDGKWEEKRLGAYWTEKGGGHLLKPLARRRTAAEGIGYEDRRQY
jgi:hypothetical protein